MENEYDSKTLQIIHSAQLYLLKAFDSFCRRHGIKYSLCGGSLIGAVRHHGFIPWDDDIDIAINRPNYNKVLEYSKDLPSFVSITDPHNQKEYPYYIPRLVLNGTELVNRSNELLKFNKGLFLDLFVFEPIPSMQMGKKYFGKASIWTTIKQRHYVPYGEYFSSRKNVGRNAIIAKMLPAWLINKKMLSGVGKWKDGPLVIDFSCRFGPEKGTFKKKLFESYIDLPFEDFNVMVFEEYNTFLTQHYGDYMAPPPESERSRSHNYIKIDLGPYGGLIYQREPQKK